MQMSAIHFDEHTMKSSEDGLFGTFPGVEEDRIVFRSVSPARSYSLGGYECWSMAEVRAKHGTMYTRARTHTHTHQCAEAGLAKGIRERQGFYPVGGSAESPLRPMEPTESQGAFSRTLGR